MGSKPNWAAGAGALGNSLMQYLQMRDRHKYREEEQLRRDASWDARDESRRVAGMEDWRLKREIAAQDAAMSADPTQSVNLPWGAMDLTDEQMLNLDNSGLMFNEPGSAWDYKPDKPDPMSKLAETLALRGEDEQRKHERNRKENIADMAQKRLLDEISAAGGGIYDDVMAGIDPQYTDWRPAQDGSFGAYTRQTKDTAPWNPFAGGEREERTTLALEANKVIAHMLADGKIDETEHGKIKDAAGKLNISSEELMRLWDPDLISQWRSLELIDGMGQ